MGPLHYTANERSKNAMAFANDRDIDVADKTCSAVGTRCSTRNILFFSVARQMTASIFGVRAADLSGPERGSNRIARARHIAMYLMHTSFSLSYVEIAKLFNRHRSTVSYACKAVEELRDVPAIDDKLLEMEKILMVVVQLASKDWE